MKKSLFFIFFILHFNIFSNSLEQIRISIKQREFEYALSKIYRVLEKNPKSYQMYNLRAEIFFAQGKIFDALSELETSIRLFPKQEKTLKTLSKKYFENHRILKSFQYAVQYDKQFSKSSEMLYILSLSSSQMGKLDIYQKTLKKSQNLLPPKQTKALFENFQALLENENFTKISKICDEKKFEFVWSEKFHNICILAKNHILAKNLHRFYLNRSIIFYKNPIYSFEYGLFLDSAKKPFYSIAMIRRAYIYFLKENNQEAVQQILLVIQRYYFESEKIKDKTVLIQLSKILSKQKAIESSQLFAMLKRSNFNWELCYFSLKIFEQKGQKKYKNATLKKLREKENSLENKELFKFYSPFKKENYLGILNIQ